MQLGLSEDLLKINLFDLYLELLNILTIVYIYQQVLSSCGKSFDSPTTWGSSLQVSHEVYLAEQYCKRLVLLSLLVCVN